jgi:hypothetical protein
MEALSKDEKKKLISRAYWDREADIDYLIDILEEKINATDENDLNSLYRRLLNTFDWYTLLKLIPEEYLLDALKDTILKQLYPKDLGHRFEYARNVLSRKTESTAG